MPTPVEQIKERLSIVDVVGSYVKLTKAGGSYKALCPFHNERTPSFNVSPSRDAFYCFGCQKGGDIFSFVEAIEGVEFPEALRMLADRAGVVLKRESGESRSERERLLAIMESAASYYEERLSEQPEVKKYLLGRGLTEETMKAWRIGYAPMPESGDMGSWSRILVHLRRERYSDEEIVKAGLVKAGERGGYYDRFRGRVMFPLFDPSGRPVAFSGRIFGNQKTKGGEDPAKYVNSPEGPLYDKSALLFGFDRAKTAIRKQNFSIVVEGQMDVIMAHQAGTENAVATSGTALTERHLTLLKRLSENVVFAFDADQAGVAASARAFSLALAVGMNVRLARVPDGKDPADYIAKDPIGWPKVVAESVHIVDYYLGVLRDEKLSGRALGEAVRTRVLPLLAEIPSKIEVSHFVAQVARALGAPETAVWEDLVRIRSARDMTPARRPAEPARDARPVHPAIERSRRQVAEEEFIGILSWQKKMDPPALDLARFESEYTALLARHGVSRQEVGPDEIEILVMRMEHTHEHGPGLEGTMGELLDTLEAEVLREKQAELWRRLAEAESRGAKEDAKGILQNYQEITPRLLEIEDRRRRRTEKV